jgi:thiamine-phosphate pyrophosphorylase
MSRPDTYSTWTAGAQRVWDAARERAAADIVDLEHLLWGLLTIESRAAELLERAGVSTEALLAACGQTLKDDERSTLACASGSQRSAAWHDRVEAVLIEARHAAFQQSAELGTEHLLCGLCQVPSDIATWLAQFGLATVNDDSQKRSVTTRDGSEALEKFPELQTPWRDPSLADRAAALRILDAAANRAREGFRVVEDFVRWSWNDGFLSQQLKECRHELTAILRQLPTAELVAARDTQADVGTEIRTTSEYRRTSPVDVAVASLKRIEEALRSLEEYSKVVDAELSPRFEQLRYRSYTLEKSIVTTSRSRLRLADEPICLLATSSLCRHGIGPAILGALQAGVKFIQLREKSLPDRELINLAKHVRQWTRDAGGIFIVNDRPDIATLVQADGVHLGQDDLDVSSARKILGPDKLVGVSTHNIEQARQAVLDGADYLGVGPCFPSTTKEFGEFPGLDFVRQVAGEIELPWYAIGGITRENLPELMIVGAKRIAVSGAICGAEEPSWAAGKLRNMLQSEPVG